MNHSLVRKASRSLVAIATTVGLSLSAAVPAQAAISVGSDCRLSANWTVKFSANYFLTLDPDGVETNYLVMNSPGPIRLWDATIYRGESTTPIWGPKHTAAPDNLHRLNTTIRGKSLRVHMKVWGGNGVCETTLRLY